MDAFKEKITSKTIIGLWKWSLDRAKEYNALIDDILLVDSSDDEDLAYFGDEEIDI